MIPVPIYKLALLVSKVYVEMVQQRPVWVSWSGGIGAPTTIPLKGGAKKTRKTRKSKKATRKGRKGSKGSKATRRR